MNVCHLLRLPLSIHHKNGSKFLTATADLVLIVDTYINRFLIISYIITVYLQHHKQLVQSLPLSTLSETRLGIDAAFYLSQVLDPPSSSTNASSASVAVKEPLLAATGGVPLSLAARVENDLRVLEKLRIKPVFVFPGLLPRKGSRNHGPGGVGPAGGPGGPVPNSPQVGNMNQLNVNLGVTHGGEYAEEMKERREAWELYERGETDQAELLFSGRSGITHWELWRSVLRMFRNRNVEFLVAPYTATAQVSFYSWITVQWSAKILIIYSWCIYSGTRRHISMPYTHLMTS